MSNLSDFTLYDYFIILLFALSTCYAPLIFILFARFVFKVIDCLKELIDDYTTRIRLYINIKKNKKQP